MNSTGEDILDDILLGDMKDGIHTLQKTVSVAKLCLFPVSSLLCRDSLRSTLILDAPLDRGRESHGYYQRTCKYASNTRNSILGKCINNKRAVPSTLIPAGEPDEGYSVPMEHNS